MPELAFKYRIRQFRLLNEDRFVPPEDTVVELPEGAQILRCIVDDEVTSIYYLEPCVDGD